MELDHSFYSLIDHTFFPLFFFPLCVSKNKKFGETRPGMEGLDTTRDKI